MPEPEVAVPDPALAVPLVAPEAVADAEPLFEVAVDEACLEEVEEVEFTTNLL